eukprot:357293-Chlamydomonas_euryale.AAC.4
MESETDLLKKPHPPLPMPPPLQSHPLTSSMQGIACSTADVGSVRSSCCAAHMLSQWPSGDADRMRAIQYLRRETPHQHRQVSRRAACHHGDDAARPAVRAGPRTQAHQPRPPLA